MGMCRIALGLAVAGTAMAAATPALAQAPVTVAASSNVFTPASVTVAVGQAVNFTNSGGMHNVRFDGEMALLPVGPPTDSAWLAGPSRTFASAGSYHFICDLHAPGMQGMVVVQALLPSPSPTPNPTPEPGPGPGPGEDSPAPAAIRRLELARAQVCAKRSPTCRRPGVVVRVDLTARGKLTGRLERRPLGRRGTYRDFGRVALGTLPAGPRSVRFTRTASGRRLTPGRYRLRVALDGQAARTLRFMVSLP